MEANLVAFLSTLASSEGTAGVGDNGYNVLVGSKPGMPILFGSYHDHPRIKIWLRADDPGTAVDDELVSTAAGRYQILARIFDSYSKQLGLKDFSPASQDAITTQMIRERGAISPILAGNFDLAVARIVISPGHSLWASLPGSGYGQRENKIEDLRKVYVAAGGQLV